MHQSGGGNLTRHPTSAGRLAARPATNATTTLKSGAIGLGGKGRDGVIQLPADPAGATLPLLLFLHGANQDGALMLQQIGPAADEARIVLVCPDSRAWTWDAIRGGFGEDVLFLNRVLEHVFARVAVDSERVFVGGFSDGATYALSLGLANGDLFPRVAAFSPDSSFPSPFTGTRGSLSRTDDPIGFSRSTGAAAGSCRDSARKDARSPSRSSMEATRCRRTLPRRRCAG